MQSLRRASNRSRQDRPSNPAPVRRAAPQPDNDNFRPRPKPANDNRPRAFRPGAVPRNVGRIARAARLLPWLAAAEAAYEVYRYWSAPVQGTDLQPSPGYELTNYCRPGGDFMGPNAGTNCGGGVVINTISQNREGTSGLGYTVYLDQGPAPPFPAEYRTMERCQTYMKVQDGAVITRVAPVEIPGTYAMPEWRLPPPALVPALDPMAQPVAVPMPVPRPIPYPAIPKRPRFHPGRSPHEQPQRGPRPAARPSPSPRPGRALQPGTAVEGVPGPGGKPFSPVKPHGRRPPGRNTKEKKLFDNKGLGTVSRVFGGMTEACDVADALHDALPKAFQVRGGCVDKAWAVYDNFGAVNWNDAIDNLIANQVEDRLWGKVFGARRQTAENLGLHSEAGVPLGFGG